MNTLNASTDELIKRKGANATSPTIKVVEGSDETRFIIEILLELCG